MMAEAPAAAARAAVSSGDQVLRELGSSRDGLAPEQAELRLAETGPNRIPQPHGPGLARQLLAQLVHFFAVMLWIAAVLAFVAGMPQLGWAIIAVVVVNGVFSFVQEYRAERATRALAALLPHSAVVIRAGRKVRVPAEHLVPGDVVLLREGDRISADARVVRSDGLRVDTSTLTGESEPVERVASRMEDAPADTVDAVNLVFAGSHVASGSALAGVVATGAATRLGAISRLTGEVVRRPTPLRVDLNRAVRLIAGFAVGAGGLFFTISLLLGTPVRPGFLFAVGVIVALVPEGLLPTLSLSLAMSAARMARRGALVRRLESVETLGSTTVICSDKTGTITANQMTARAVAVPWAGYRLSGSGYDPGGTILVDGRPLDALELAALDPVLRTAALCVDARLELHAGRWSCVGDPTEGALLAMARKGGVERERVERSSPRVREFPFESRRRRMSVVNALPSGVFEVMVKGSPEAVMASCTRVAGRRGSDALGADAEAEIVAEVERLAGEGLRVLALARKEVDRVPSRAEAAERELVFLGLVGMKDPVRPEVPGAVARCRRAGIRVVMLTGDHPATAVAVARRAGLVADRYALGSELPADDGDLVDLLGEVSVVARVSPEQKLRIAEALQSCGEVVAMTGDGVNDAPALRRADIGVAMGVAGTDVAREAADVVLLDDNFAHIVEAVEEGRAAFDNIRRFLTYHLTDNVAELAPFVVWALSGGRIPLMLSVLQILALDIGTDLLPALALGAERPEPHIMDRPPRPRRGRLLDRRIVGRAFGFLGPVEAAASMAMLPLGAALFFGWTWGGPLPADPVALATLSTMVFGAIVLLQMANAFECRSTPASLFEIGPWTNRLLIAAAAAEALALALFVYLPPLGQALGHRPLMLPQWLLVAGTPWLLVAAEEARKLLVRGKLRGGRQNHRARRVRPWS